MLAQTVNAYNMVYVLSFGLMCAIFYSMIFHSLSLPSFGPFFKISKAWVLVISDTVEHQKVLC